MALHASATAELLARFPPKFERELASRVLVRPCVTREEPEVHVSMLAYARDSWSESVLVALGERMWEEDEVASGGMGYTIVPISLSLAPPERSPVKPAAAKEDSPKEASPSTAVQGAAAHSEDTRAAAQTAEGGVAAAAEEEVEEEVEEEGLSPWEMAEGLWRRLETAGVIEIERDEHVLPQRISLRDGAASWTGEVPSDFFFKDVVEVRLLDGAKLAVETAKPECGFCKFMKAGPCGEVFEAWEDCVSAANDAKADFVEMCGKPTMALKMCTDKHHEYYGMLSGENEDDGDGEEGKQVAAES